MLSLISDDLGLHGLAPCCYLLKTFSFHLRSRLFAFRGRFTAQEVILRLRGTPKDLLTRVLKISPMEHNASLIHCAEATAQAKITILKYFWVGLIGHCIRQEVASVKMSKPEFYPDPSGLLVGNPRINPRKGINWGGCSDTRLRTEAKAVLGSCELSKRLRWLCN